MLHGIGPEIQQGLQRGNKSGLSRFTHMDLHILLYAACIYIHMFMYVYVYACVYIYILMLYGSDHSGQQFRPTPKIRKPHIKVKSWPRQAAEKKLLLQIVLAKCSKAASAKDSAERR